MQENHSFLPNDCAPNLIQTYFEQKFRCATTKSQAIVVNILAPMATNDLKEHVCETHCITLLTGASNHGATKLCLGLIHYFLPYEGVNVKSLDFRNQPGETSDIRIVGRNIRIVDYLN